MAKRLNEKLENVHEMCTKAENDAAFQLLLARNSFDLQGFPEVDPGADEPRPTDYESVYLGSYAYLYVSVESLLRSINACKCLVVS